MEVMVQFIDGDAELRDMVIDILRQRGLTDRRGYFNRELDSWDTWTLEGLDRKVKVAAMCRAWLDKSVT